MDTMSRLLTTFIPNEVWEHIIQFCNKDVLRALRCVNKQIHWIVTCYVLRRLPASLRDASMCFKPWVVNNAWLHWPETNQQFHPLGTQEIVLPTAPYTDNVQKGPSLSQYAVQAVCVRSARRQCNKGIGISYYGFYRVAIWSFKYDCNVYTAMGANHIPICYDNDSIILICINTTLVVFDYSNPAIPVLNTYRDLEQSDIDLIFKNPRNGLVTIVGKQ